MVNPIINKIQEASDVFELKAIHEAFPLVLKRMEEDGYSIQRIYKELNHMHHDLSEKAIAFAYQDTLNKQIGRCPEEWCWILMGSSARMEQTIWTDQDNGLFFRCEPFELSECQLFIEHFANQGVRFLEKAGYPLCTGYVMATNPRWCQSLEQWKNTLPNMIPTKDHPDFRLVSIAIDMVPLCGSARLIKDTKRLLFNELHKENGTLDYIKHSLSELYIPISPFGKIFFETHGEFAGAFPIKHGGYSQLVNMIKYFSIVCRIEASSTYQRIRMLKQKGIFSEKEGMDLEEALTLFLSLRFKRSLANKEQFKTDYIHFNDLSNQERIELKYALKTVRTLRNSVRKRVIIQ